MGNIGLEQCGKVIIDDMAKEGITYGMAHAILCFAEKELISRAANEIKNKRVEERDGRNEEKERFE